MKVQLELHESIFTTLLGLYDVRCIHLVENPVLLHVEIQALIFTPSLALFYG